LSKRRPDCVGGEVQVQHRDYVADIYEVSRACATGAPPADYGAILRHLLTDRPQLFADDHFGGIHIDDVSLEFHALLMIDILVATDIDQELLDLPEIERVLPHYVYVRAVLLV